MEMHKKQIVLFNGFSGQLRVKWPQQREGEKRTQAKYVLDFQQGPNKSVWLYLLTYFNVSENQNDPKWTFFGWTGVAGLLIILFQVLLIVLQ